MMNELDKAAVAYEYSLRHNPYNIQVSPPHPVGDRSASSK